MPPCPVMLLSKCPRDVAKPQQVLPRRSLCNSASGSWSESERQLHIRKCANFKCTWTGMFATHGLPAHLCRMPCPTQRRKRRHRRRGKCGGLLVKIKSHLAFLHCADPFGVQAECQIEYSRIVSWRSWRSLELSSSSSYF